MIVLRCSTKTAFRLGARPLLPLDPMPPGHVLIVTIAGHRWAWPLDSELLD